jgi:hypothetical protein
VIYIYGCFSCGWVFSRDRSRGEEGRLVVCDACMSIRTQRRVRTPRDEWFDSPIDLEPRYPPGANVVHGGSFDGDVAVGIRVSGGVVVVEDAYFGPNLGQALLADGDGVIYDRGSTID